MKLINKMTMKVELNGWLNGWLAKKSLVVLQSKLLVYSLSQGVWGLLETKEIEQPRTMPSAYYSLTARSGRVAWREYVDPNGTVTRVRWRDLRTGETGEHGTAFGTGVQGPAIDGEWLVFFEYSGPWATNDVVAVNLVTQERRRITQTPYEKFDLAIRGSLVVWSEDTSRPDGEGLSLGGDLWQHDLTTGQTSALVVAEDLQAGPWISGDHLLWTDMRDGTWRPRGPPLQADAYYLNLARADPPIRIGTVPHAKVSPRLVGDWLVWRDTAEDRAHIWAMPWSPPP